MKTNKLSDAFINAFSGIRFFFVHERNGKIQLMMGLVTAITGVLLKISIHEWLVVFICIAAVLSMEMMNSALERLCDHLHPSIHPQMKIVKDVAAGAVLFVSIISAVIGGFIFLPKIAHYL